MTGESYHYFVSTYNSAWHNERTVEVAIALRYLNLYRGRRVLEVGNVLSHYVPTSHEIVDKYERGPGVRNVDVSGFTTARSYDLIISVSTLEHVGWDEDDRDADKPVRAAAHLARLLSEDGTLLVTLPLGYNPHVDDALRTGAFDLDHVAFLKRVSWDNRWREVKQAELVRPVGYGWPFPAANVVAVGIRTRREANRGTTTVGRGALDLSE